MDKLRALQYLRAAAVHRSFSSAARTLGVSVPAVAKLISALERDLKIQLFERSTRGLTLTAVGSRYLDACSPALARLEDADEQVRGLATRPAGTLVVAVQQVIARGFFAAALQRFHLRFPDIELDIRTLEHDVEASLPGVDLMLVLGWPQVKELICRRLGAGLYQVVASPTYWRAHGIPERPADLQRHQCLTVRGIDGAVMDVWSFTRGDEREVVHARGWLTASHAHRDVFMELALAGHGVMRILDWINQAEIDSGRLVPALVEWESTEVVPVNLLYAPGIRRIPRARVFIDFVTDLFDELQRARGGAVAGTEKPSWMRRSHGRASDLVLRGDRMGKLDG
jgi:LysR family transcriptional regulator for bpeEF and oprC